MLLFKIRGMQKILTKIQKYLLYAFVFTLPWQTIWIVCEVFFDTEKWQYGTIGIYISDIFLISWIILSIYLYKPLIILYIKKNQALITITSLLSLWGFTSIIWADDKILAFYFALKLLFVIYLFILVQIIPIKMRTLSFVFITSVFIQSILGLYQFISQQTFAQKFLGLQFYDIWRGGTAIVNLDSERWLRAYGGMPHPNIFGGLLLCALLLNIYLYLTTPNDKLYVRFYILLGIGLFAINILFTFSRITWIASFVSLITFVLYIIYTKKFTLQNIYVPITLIVLTLALATGLYQDTFFSRAVHDTTISHNSISERALYLQHAKKLISEQLFVGTGIGNYTNTIYTHDLPQQPIWYYQPVHNIYYLIIAEIGIIGSILFLIFLILVFYNIYLHRKNISTIQSVFIILFIILLLISIFDHWIWSSHFGLLLFFFIAGLSLRNKK